MDQMGHVLDWIIYAFTKQKKTMLFFKEKQTSKTASGGALQRKAKNGFFLTCSNKKKANLFVW